MQARTSERVLDLLIGCGRRTQQKGQRQCLAVVVAMLHNTCVVPFDTSVVGKAEAPASGGAEAEAPLPAAEIAALRLHSLASDKTLVSVLLRLAAPTTSSSSGSSRKEEDEGRADEEGKGQKVLVDEDEAGEWIVTLLEQCLRKGLLKELWNASSAGSEFTGDDEIEVKEENGDENGNNSNGSSNSNSGSNSSGDSSCSNSRSSNSDEVVAAVPIAVTAEQLVLLHATAAILKDWRLVTAATRDGDKHDCVSEDGNADNHSHKEATAAVVQNTPRVCAALVGILASMPPSQRPPTAQDAACVCNNNSKSDGNNSDKDKDSGGVSSSTSSSTSSPGSRVSNTNSNPPPSPVMATALMHYELNEAGRSIVLEALADAVNTAGPSEYSTRPRMEASGEGGRGGAAANVATSDVVDAGATALAEGSTPSQQPTPSLLSPQQQQEEEEMPNDSDGSLRCALVSAGLVPLIVQLMHGKNNSCNISTRLWLMLLFCFIFQRIRSSLPS